MEQFRKTPQVIDPTGDGDRTIGQLVADVKRETSGLVKAEIALAKADLRQAAVHGGMGVGLFGGAAVIAVVGLILLSFTGAHGLIAAGLPSWTAFGIVALVLFVIAGVLAFVGMKAMKKVQALKQTLESSRQSIETIKTAAKIG